MDNVCRYVPVNDEIRFEMWSWVKYVISEKNRIVPCAAVKLLSEFYFGWCKILRPFSIFFFIQMIWELVKMAIWVWVYGKIHQFISYSKEWWTACNEITFKYVSFHNSLIRIMPLHLIRWWWSMHYSNNLHNTAYPSPCRVLVVIIMHARTSNTLYTCQPVVIWVHFAK